MDLPLTEPENHHNCQSRSRLHTHNTSIELTGRDGSIALNQEDDHVIHTTVIASIRLNVSP